MEKGKKVARAGWNGKGMFLFLTEECSVRYSDLKGNAAKYVTEQVTGMPDTVKVNAHIDMKAADDRLLLDGLLPRQIYIQKIGTLSNSWQLKFNANTQNSMF